MVIDVILLILLAVACFKGYTRGLIVAIFSFLAVFIGVAAALKLSVMVSGWLQNSTHISRQWLPFVSFLLVMIAVVIVVRLVANLLQKSVEAVMLGWLNRLGGILFYVAIFVLIYSVVLFYAIKMNVIKPEVVSASKTYPLIAPLGPRAVNALGFVIPLFKGLFTQLETFFDTIVKHH